MIKALLKKQALETLAFFTTGKTGERRKTGAIVGFAVLMAYVVFAGGFMFYEYAEALCAPLALNGYAWLYFALMGTMAAGMGVVGGIFIAKSKLYEAKDNDLLLSMPIPSKYILLSRSLSLYGFVLLFQTLVFVPSLIVYFITVGFSFLALLLGTLTLFILALGTTALCCLLGFLVAWLTSRLPMKNLVTMVLTIGFLVAYMLLMGKVTDGLSYLVASPEEVSSLVQTALYPFAALGKGIVGDALSWLAFFGVFVGVSALVFLLLARTYLRVATHNRGERKAKYKGETGVQRGTQFALLKKEFLRFVKTPMYMLNAAMGTIFVLIYTVFTLIDGSLLGLFDSGVMQGDDVFLLTTVIVCMLTSMNMISACSVSLEGDSLWVVRSLPVSAWNVLKAKLHLHILVTGAPILICGFLVGVGVGLGVLEILLTLAMASVGVLFFGAFGLTVNLKFPNLKWTNETVAVKQGVATMITMFGGWGVVLTPVLLYFLIGEYFVAWAYVLLWLFVMAGATVGLIAWLKKRGVQVFERL